MKRITIIIITLLLCGCGQNRNRQPNTEAETAIIKQTYPTVLIETDPKTEYSTILDKIKEQAHKVSEDEFNGKLYVEKFADAMEIALHDCRNHLISKLDARDADFEFSADTLWLNQIPSVLSDLELNHTTMGMMQANKFHRELTRRTVEKYYSKLLAMIPAHKKTIVKDAHAKWLKSIDADYSLAGAIASYQDGTIILATWSRYVDDLVEERIAFYYDCLKSLPTEL